MSFMQRNKKALRQTCMWKLRLHKKLLQIFFINLIGFPMQKWLILCETLYEIIRLQKLR